MQVSELMSSALVPVTSDTAIETCALRMAHLDVRQLLVVDAGGRLSGVVTDAAIQRTGSHDPADPVCAADIAVPADVLVHPEDDLLVVLRLLVRTHQDFAAVVDEHGHPIGLVTEHDLLKVALLVVPDTLLLRCLPQRPVITISHTQLASLALDVMVRNQIRHLPVTATDGTVVGMVSYRDLVAAGARPRPVLVEDVQSGGLVTAKATDTLVICAARMLEYRVGCLPILDQCRAVGIVTRRDLMEAAAAALEQDSLFESDDPRLGPAASTGR